MVFLLSFLVGLLAWNLENWKTTTAKNILYIGTLIKRNSKFRIFNKTILDKISLILITYVGIKESSHSIINDKPFNL